MNNKYIKNHILTYVVSGLLFFGFDRKVVSAAGAFTTGIQEAHNAAEGGGLFIGSFMDVLTKGTQFLLSFVAIIATIAIIYGGFLYLTDAGSEKKAETGKKVITYAVIGLIIIGAAALITNVTISIFK